MEMPRPTEAHRKLERFAGIWTGEERMQPSPWDPEGGIAEGRTEGRVALGGFAVISDYEQRRGGEVTFTGHAVYTYDANEGCCVLYWFDCFGMPPNTFKGSFDGDRITLLSEETCDGAPRLSRLSYDLSEPGRMTSRMEISQDGKTWTLFFEGAYTRQD